MHVGEVLNMRWQDLDFAQKRLVIPAPNTKTRRQRIIPLSDVALDIATRMREGNDTEYFFINKETKQKYTTIYKTFTRIRKLAGLPNTRPHDMRHAFLSLAHKGGASIFTLRALAGHSNLKTTERYITIDRATLERATDNVADIIKDGTRAGLEDAMSVEMPVDTSLAAHP